MVIRSRKLRPNRSSFHTMSVSPDSSFFKQRSRAGRLVVAPETPSSLNTVLHPAFFKVASCRAGSGRRSRREHSRISCPLFCTRHLQPAKPFIYRPFRNGANLTLCETCVVTDLRDDLGPRRNTG